MGCAEVAVSISLVLLLGTLLVKVRIWSYAWRGLSEVLASDLYSPDPVHRRRARIGFAIALVICIVSMVLAFYFWFYVVDPSLRRQRSAFRPGVSCTLADGSDVRTSAPVGVIDKVLRVNPIESLRCE